MKRNLEGKEDLVRIKKEEEERQQQILLLMGTNRTGKSTLARKVIKNWKDSRPGDMVIGFDPQNQFSGLLDYEINIKDAYGKKDWANFINENNFANCLVVLDEFRILNDKNSAANGLVELLSMRSEKNIDIIIIVHSPSLVLNLLGTYITQYYLFYTQAVTKGFKDKIPDYEKLTTGLNIINEYSIKNKIYTEKYNYGKHFYPNFPYVVYDIKNNKLLRINFQKFDDET